MKKILFTCLTGIPNRNMGGAHRIILEIIKGLDLTKYQMGFLSSHYSIDNIQRKDINKLMDSKMSLPNLMRMKLYNESSFFRFLVNNPFYWNFFLLKAGISIMMSRQRLKNNDLVHSHDSISPFFYQGTPQKKIITIHTKGAISQDLQYNFGKHKIPGYQKGILEKMENKSLESADIITFPSIAAKDIFYKTKEIHEHENIRIIYNGVDLNIINSIVNSNLISELNIFNKRQILLLNIAEHIRPKNIEKALHVVKILSNDLQKEVLFINVGKGPETNKIKKLVNEFNINKNVLFFTYLPNNDIIYLMKHFDYLLHLSESVVFDMVVLEAISCGMTVIASNEGGNREVLQHRKNGYLVNPNDIREIVNIILNSTKEIKNNAKKSSQEFSIDKMTKSYEELYNELIIKNQYEK